ncbi:DUF523 domain-containing protein [Actinomyces vulturis]|uniref:DUF523 domain-containing protein n=1 Tax=Actinomyces vulturis TaxID=1857645 RepID=UPI000835B3EE|nr:DUF523 domain-containing protein [Actinomyces vulturis]
MKIMVSACLMGRRCKYNGGHNFHAALADFLTHHEVIEICPEVTGGLPTPRLPAELIDGIALRSDGVSVDDKYERGAQAALEQALREQPDLIILQPRSPSCGVTSIYDGSFSGTLIAGAGKTAQLLLDHGFQVIDADECARLLRSGKLS